MNTLSLELPKFLTRFLNYRYAFFCILLIISVLYIHIGFTEIKAPDDYFHDYILSHGELLNSTNVFSDYFSFATGDAAYTHAMMSKIGLPWWTDPELKISFFRPFTTFTHWLDFQLWPNSHFLEMLHSIIWYLLCIAAAYKLYQFFFKQRWLALFATLLFALSLNHYIPNAWIAGRNALLTGLLSLIILQCYHYAVNNRSLLGYLLTPILMLIGLLCGEATLSVTAGLFAYALFIDKRTKIQALLSLLPSAVICLIWLYYYHYAGFGTANSGYYIDPFGNPVSLIKNLLTGTPLLIFSDFINLPINIIQFHPLAIYTTLLLAIIFIAVFTKIFLLPLLKKDRYIAFWLTAYFISLLPFCAVLPGSRVLFIPSVFSIGLIASIIYNLNNKTLILSSGKKYWLHALIISRIFMPIFFLLWLSFFLPQQKNELHDYKEAFRELNVNQDSVILSISNRQLQTATSSIDTKLKQGTLPHTIINLFNFSSAIHERFTLYRDSDKQLTVSNPNGLIYFNVYRYIHKLLRNTDNKPFYKGQRFDLDGVQVEIIEPNKILGATKIRYHFSDSLNLKKYILLIFDPSQQKFVKIKIPEIGSELHYPEK